MNPNVELVTDPETHEVSVLVNSVERVRVATDGSITCFTYGEGEPSGPA
jgi:hypothetical protein